MRVAPIPILTLLALWTLGGCGGNGATAPPAASDGPVANVLVAPPSNLVWTADDQVVFWAPIYEQLTVSPVRLTAVDPHTLEWHYVETVDRHGERVSVSPDGATAWFVDKPTFDNPGDTLSVVYRMPLATGQAESVATSKPVKLVGLHGYAQSVVADPEGPGALFAAPPDSLWSVDDSTSDRTLLTTGCSTIQAISADGTRLLCSSAGTSDLVLITLPGGTPVPLDVHSVSPTRFPQGFGFVGGTLHAVVATAGDSSWVISDWDEASGTSTLLFETSSFLENPDLAFWSADGARIAIWTEECLDPNFGLCTSGTLARLYVIDRATGAAQVVASHHGPQGLRGGVATFAPDDQRVAYTIQHTLYIQSIE